MANIGKDWYGLQANCNLFFKLQKFTFRMISRRCSFREIPHTSVILAFCMLSNAMISNEIRKVTIFGWFSIFLQFLAAITTHQYNEQFTVPVIYTHRQLAFFTSLHHAYLQNKLTVNRIQHLIIWYLMIIKNKLYCVTLPWRDISRFTRRVVLSLAILITFTSFCVNTQTFVYFDHFQGQLLQATKIALTISS